MIVQHPRAASTLEDGQRRVFIVVDYAYGWGSMLTHGYYIGEVVDDAVVCRFGTGNGVQGMAAARDWIAAGGDAIAHHIREREAARVFHGSTAAMDAPPKKRRRRGRRPATDVGDAAAEALNELAAREGAA